MGDAMDTNTTSAVIYDPRKRNRGRDREREDQSWIETEDEVLHTWKGRAMTMKEEAICIECGSAATSVCKDGGCGELVFCDECFVAMHKYNSQHIPHRISELVGARISPKSHSAKFLSKDIRCPCFEEHLIELQLVTYPAGLVNATFTVCSCREYHGDGQFIFDQLIGLYGIFPATPKRPELVFDIRIFELFDRMQYHDHARQKAFWIALCETMHIVFKHDHDVSHLGSVSKVEAVLWRVL